MINSQSILVRVYVGFFFSDIVWVTTYMAFATELEQSEK